MQYIAEGSWAFPHVHSAVVKLEKLLSEPLSPKKAIEELYNIFGNDELFDILEDNKEEGNADVRGAVKRSLKKYLQDKVVTKNIDLAILSRLRKLVGLDVEEKSAADLKAAREEFLDTWAAYNIKKYSRVSDAADAFERYMNGVKVKDEAKKIGMTPAIAYDMIKKMARQFNLKESIEEMKLNQTQIHSLEQAISDAIDRDNVQVSGVQKEDDCYKAFYSFEDAAAKRNRSGSMYFNANFLDGKIEDFEEVKFGVNEAGKVHTLPNPGFKPRGAPEIKARAFDKPGTDRSVLDKPGKGNYHAVEFADEGDWIYVLIGRDDTPMTFGAKKDPNDEYHGIYLSFFPDGKIDADTHDVTAKRQWMNDKEKIIKAAKDALKDKDLPNVYDGLGGKSVKRGTRKMSFDVENHVARDDKKMSRHRSDESTQMITFKEFLSEAKPPMKRVKEPGWYVVDHMDKPIEGPMSESGARERADEMNAGKKGGDIPEFDVLHFDADDIRRMSRAEKY